MCIPVALAIGVWRRGWMSGWVHDLTGSYQLASMNCIIWNALTIAIMLFILTRTLNTRQRVVATA